MAGTPPRLSATLPPAPISRIRVATPMGGPRNTPIDLLAFGRGLDASIRDDTEYFLSQPSHDLAPALALAAQLAAFVRAGDEVAGSIIRCLESVDPADIAAGMIQFRAHLGDSPSFAAGLLEALRGDPGLEDQAAAAILGYGALEQYYRAQATHSAKRRFDAHRMLIELATQTDLRSIQADAPIGGGLRVWEGWQALTALTGLFGLNAIQAIIERRAETITLGLLVGADVLLRTHARAEAAEIEAALEQLWRYAKDRRRARDLTPISQAREGLIPAPTGATDEHRSEAATDPDLLPSRALPRMFRNSLLGRAPQLEPSPDRSVATFIEELSSVLERYEVLIVGDDNSLVLEVAPLLLQSFIALYQALAAQHPRIEQGLYDETVELTDRHRREILALRVLVGRAANLERRFLQLEEAVATASTNLEQAAPSRPPPPPPPPPSTIREAQAEALLLVLTARGLDPPPPLVAAIKAGAEPDTYRRWLARAAVASTLTEVFSEPAPPEDSDALLSR